MLSKPSDQPDFSLWAKQTAQLLRERKFNEIDLDTLAQEVEDLGKSERRSIGSYLTVLLTHLIKWQYQPAGRHYTPDGEPKGSWAGSITYSRIELLKLLQENPSLQNYPALVLSQSYADAVKVVIKETGLKEFPNQCPFSIEQLLDENWWPNS
jgi:Domain of unknown function DUF29